MESQDKEKEYERSIWEIYRKEWETASNEKRIELNKRMRRWQELMKNGMPASQAYAQVMEQESDESPIYMAIEEESDYRVMKEPSGKRLAIAFGPRMGKVPLVFLSLALVAAIVYGFVITGDRDALNTELESVQGVIIATQTQLSKTKSDLTKTQAELSSTQETLSSTQIELSTTVDTLTAVRNEVTSLKNTIISVQDALKAVGDKLKLYKETLGVTVFSEGSSLPRQMSLIDNPIATNPTWQELKAFLLADPTDDETYITNSFDCDAFAVMLHNNAEATGIKAAFVGVYFRDSDISHALNAFKTTDKGLVYVDCTGGPSSIRRTSFEWDKIAYVVKGKEYGAISLGKNTPLNYASYEKMKTDWNSYVAKLEAYNEEVRRFKTESFGLIERAYITWSEEHYRIEAWKRTLEGRARVLDNLLAKLEYVWEEDMGIVESIEVYW